MKNNATKQLGFVVRGSVSEGLQIILSGDESIENYPIGSLVKIIGDQYEYLAMITNSKIEDTIYGETLISNPRISSKTKRMIINSNPNFFRKQIIEVSLLSKKQKVSNIVERADVTPVFNAYLVNVNEEDIKVFYEIKEENYILGTPKTPLGLEIKIPIDIEKLVNLSFGIFGKSGSGKTFLGNIIAGYLILHDLELEEKGDKGIRLLIFDMHSEYGLELRDNKMNKIADGVGTIFKDLVIRYSPDLTLARERGLREFKINLKEITPEDIQLIAPIFGVSQTFINQLYTIKDAISKEIGLGDLWVLGFFEGEFLEESLTETDDGPIILSELRTRLGNSDLSQLRKRVIQVLKRKSPALVNTFVSQTSKMRRILTYPLSTKSDSVEDLVESLLDENGGHVIISFGKYEKELPLYMIIANLVARRLRRKILELAEKGKDVPSKIVIFVEEAHNFLGKDTYNLSPFGEIAREMRKKGVILCVIDQKPGELDSNVISMLWTNFVLALTDRKDIEQALMGIDKPELYRRVVPVLAPQETLVFGEAIKYPIVLMVENYKTIEKKFKEISKNMITRQLEKEEKLREQGWF